MLSISNYHYIREHFDAKYPSIFGVTPKIFKSQLKLLKSKSDFISPKDLISNIKDILKSNENYFFVTFDDGLKEQYDFALPILDELNIPAVFFANSINFDEKKVTTVHKIHLLRSILSPKEFLEILTSKMTNISISDVDYNKAQNIYIYDDKESAGVKYLLNFKIDFKIQEVLIGSIFEDYFDSESILNKLYMTSEQIVDLSKKGYLGSHSHSHFPIGLLEEKRIKFELENSKLFFEKFTDSKIEMIAYPYGTPEACTEQVADIAKSVGYKLGFTTTRGINIMEDNLLLLNRFDCNDLPGGKNYKEL